MYTINSCRDSAPWPSNKMHYSEPNFLTKKVDSYFEDRVQPFGRHLPYHFCEPKAGDIILESNDYLQIANHPDIMIDQRKDANVGGGLSPVFDTVSDSEKRNAQDCIGKFLGYPQVEICQSGYVANVGLLQAIGTGRPLYMDFYAHYSFHEGAKSACVKPTLFSHNDPVSLEKKIKLNGPGVIVVDSIYITQGTVSPLLEIAKISNKYGCVLVVDESHSFGLMGPEGRGLVAELNLQNYVHFITASLAKGCVTRAGFVAGTKRNIESIRYNSGHMIFSAGITRNDAVRIKAVIELIKNSNARRERLWGNSKRLRDSFNSWGYNHPTETFIIPIMTGTEKRLIEFVNAIEPQGVFGAPFCSPATPKRKTLYRLSIHSALSLKDCSRISDICKTTIEKVLMPKSGPGPRFAS